jgi:hypothetical protein
MKINDPQKIQELLRGWGEPLTPAQARILLAREGYRVTQKALEAALGLTPLRSRANPRKRALKPLDDLPLTPQERAIFERCRRSR